MFSLIVQRMSPSRLLSLCVLSLALVFVANIMYSRKVSAEIDAYASSITQNGAAGVVLLATVTEDVRLISTRAMWVRDSTTTEDREAIAGWLDDMDRAIAEYLRTGEYPGELELYLRAERQRGPFVAAVGRALATAADTPAARSEVRQALSAATDRLFDAIRELTHLNAEHIGQESAALTEVRRHARVISNVFRVLTLFLAVAGIVLARATNRRHIQLVEESRRLADARANELELFGGRVAHDLRGPLAAIQLTRDGAVRSDRPDAPRQALERIGRQVRRMSEMIDALLAFAQAGARVKPGICTNIAEVVEDVASDNQGAADEARTSLVIEPMPNATVACSVSVLTIILSNLVRNAVKYIDGGESDLRRVTVRMRERDGRLCFEVEDTGPGLPRGTEEQVFEPFVRVSNHANGGIGLGLATVKRLVEAHRGTTGVHSVPGRGCRFRFDLPCAGVSSEMQAVSSDGGRQPTVRRSATALRSSPRAR